MNEQQFLATLNTIKKNTEALEDFSNRTREECVDLCTELMMTVRALKSFEQTSNHKELFEKYNAGPLVYMMKLRLEKLAEHLGVK